jgi:hypothetical protein
MILLTLLKAQWPAPTSLLSRTPMTSHTQQVRDRDEQASMAQGERGGIAGLELRPYRWRYRTRITKRSDSASVLGAKPVTETSYSPRVR